MKFPKSILVDMELFLSADVSSEEKLFLLNGIIEKPQTNPPSDMAVLEDMFYLNIYLII